jgi:putative transposase
MPSFCSSYFWGNSQDAGVAALLESVLNQVLQAQTSEQLAAEPYERTEDRKGYQNGTYPHQLTTRVGTIHALSFAYS